MAERLPVEVRELPEVQGDIDTPLARVLAHEIPALVVRKSIDLPDNELGKVGLHWLNVGRIMGAAARLHRWRDLAFEHVEAFTGLSEEEIGGLHPHAGAEDSGTKSLLLHTTVEGSGDVWVAAPGSNHERIAAYDGSGYIDDMEPDHPIISY